MNNQPIILRAGALEAALSPEAGGSLRWLSYDGVDLLRRAPDGSADPLAMASFPLVPYANRIAHGRFLFDGKNCQLRRNFGDHPHSIHGVGWQTKWTAKETYADSVKLVKIHDVNDDWPWPFRVGQCVALKSSHMSMSLSLTNVGDTPMPAGLGFHPYLLADAATHLQFDARSLWLSTPDMLPDREVSADRLGDWSHPAPVPGDSLIDNVYGGWGGSATVLRGDGLRLTLRATGADWLHVFRPPGGTDFCLEPVSHMPDAINRPSGMAILVPGETMQLSMTIEIDRTLPKSAGIA